MASSAQVAALAPSRALSWQSVDGDAGYNKLTVPVAHRQERCLEHIHFSSEQAVGLVSEVVVSVCIADWPTAVVSVLSYSAMQRRSCDAPLLRHIGMLAWAAAD